MLSYLSGTTLDLYATVSLATSRLHRKSSTQVLCCFPLQKLLLISTTYVPRVSPICGRYLSLGQLELTDIHMLRAAWHSRGPRLDR